jgi:hypothetical protein
MENNQKKDKKNKKNGRKWEELRLLYQVVVADMHFYKNQQWMVTNYVMGAYAAMITVSSILSNPTRGGMLRFERYTLAILSLVSAVTGVLLIGQLENTLRSGRIRLERIFDQFTYGFYNSLSPQKLEIRHKKGIIVSSVLQVVIILGGIVTTYLVISL